jgi:MFS family permease
VTSALSVLRLRNFGPYVVGNAFSASGSWFHNLAASILVYNQTHSALWLGILAACQFGPVLLLAPWAGSAADTFDRRLLLLVTQPIAVCISMALASLVWVGAASTWVVIVFSVALGVITAYSSPAQMALVGSLVPREFFTQAVAFNSMTFNIARAVGPAAAAGVIAAFGTGAAFAVNAASYLVLVGALAVVSPTPVPRAEVRTSLRESLSMLRDRPALAGYLAIVMAVGFTSDPVNTESPAIADVFGYAPTWAGATIGCFGAGAVLAAMTISHRIGTSHRHLVAMLLTFGAGIALMAASPWFPLACACLLVAGFGYLGSNAGATARLQLAVDDAQRGRIMALWSVAFLGARPVASLIDGALAHWAGVRVAAPVLAVPVLAAAAVLMRLRARSGAELFRPARQQQLCDERE